MKSIPGYGKILTLGSIGSENALIGEVILQEKVDGSLFGFGKNEDGELTFRSKGKVQELEAPDKMFSKAADYVKSLVGTTVWNNIENDSYFYCEYLQNPKHNVLAYERTPNNHLVLFDAMSHGKWVDRVTLAEIASLLGIDLIPQLHVGEVGVEGIKEFLTMDSFLGKEKIEGVVIKNYSQTLLLGGQVFSLFTKYVREEFKERHEIEWKGKGPNKKEGVIEYCKSFANEGRWQKAVIHLKELDNLTNSPKDIGPLIKMIQEDITEEEEKNIKDFLYKTYIEDIHRFSVGGFVQWYKDKLLENLT